MAFDYDMQLYCACGHSARISAETIPPSWGDQPANIPSSVWDRVRCTSCGRRGKPKQVIVSPVENRYRSGAYPEFGESLGRR
ncbi:hypothetical protein [Cypionkella sinensis]|uniref:Uncharacterized protein n=1 Tax=Cypionkella sinensis TaxID=1756043 RepID=A0ABV7IV96_9RHOB